MNNFDIQDFCGGEKVLALVDKKVPFGVYAELCALIVISFVCLVCDGFMIGSEVTASLINKSNLAKTLIFILAFLIHATAEFFWAVSIFKRLDKKVGKIIITETRVTEVYFTKSAVETREVLLDNVSDFIYRGKTLKLIANGSVEVFCPVSVSEGSLSRLREIINKSKITL